jgi:hypothetical protein
MKSIIKSKLSQGHVEMILSFTIFAGFVVAMFFFLNPAKENKINYGSLDAAENVILENISVSYDSIAVILNNPINPINPEACFSVNNNFGLTEKSLVTDEKGTIVPSNNDYSNLKIKIMPLNTNVKLYRIYFSDAFTSNNLGTTCNPLLSTDYSFGVLTSENNILWENIQAMNKSYIENYDQLKKDLNVREDFEFVVYNLNRTQVLFDTTSTHRLKTSFVLSRDIPMRIINKNATAIDIVLNLRVW